MEMFIIEEVNHHAVKMLGSTATCFTTCRSV